MQTPHAYIDLTRALDLRCGGPRRSLPPPLLSRREGIRLGYRLREQSAGHADAVERSLMLTLVDDEVGRLELTWEQAHDACDLRHGALGDTSLTTAELTVALDTLRRVPRP